MKFTCSLIAIAVLHLVCIKDRVKASLTLRNKTAPDKTIIDLFEPVGCFRDRRGPHRAFSNAIKSFRELVNVSNRNASFKAIIHACAEVVSMEYSFRYFGVQYYHQCWSGANGSLTYNRYGKSDRCLEDYGVGMTWANFVYRFVQVNGNWSQWSPWQPCSVTCGGGNRTRNRACTEPRPKWEGKDCIGMNVSSEECNQHKCNANYRSDKQGFSVESPMYKWSGNSFVKLQSLQTYGAYDVKSFSNNGETYLAFANRRNIDSFIYKWNGSRFVLFRSIPTHGAFAWEPFAICGETLLAVANFYRNSVVYRLSGSRFIKYQELSTQYATDLKAFEYKGHTYLAVANHRDERGRSNINSALYKLVQK